MANNSDYKKVRTQIENLLPAPYQSDAIGGVMENTVNRFLSKKETEYVDGYIGTPNTNAIYSRQIPEESIIAQAHQLQPVIAATLGTEKRYMAWVDIINELEEQGVDMENFADWGKTDKYNWVPPIDIDKLIHFRDYFWVNANTSVTPEYITIKSASNEAAIKVSMFENMIERYGETFPIVGLSKSATDQIFQISQISPTEIKVVGNITSSINPNDFITVQNTVNNNKQAQITGATYSGTSGKTTLSFASGTFTGPTETIGQFVLSKYDGIIVDDDLTLLFEPGFKYYTRDTANVALLNQYATVITSALTNDKTVIKFGTTFTDSRIGGVASLTELVADAAAIVATEAEGAERHWSSNNFWVHRSDVENFASARQAGYPIIEYFRGLELNEFIETKHDWQYRASTIAPFASSVEAPPLFELIPFTAFTLLSGNVEILLAADYGDATATFMPGTVFSDNLGTQITVVSSTFAKSGINWRTRIVVDTPFTVVPTSLHPITTLSGDAWAGYNKHWVYNGITDELPAAARPRSVMNEFHPAVPTVNVPSSGAVLYTERATAYSQLITVVDDSNKTFEFANGSIKNHSLIDQIDVRVYFNGERMYGGYSEILDNTGVYVDGIEIDADFDLDAGDELLFEVAPAVLEDHGFANIQVRTVLSDAEYNLLATADKTELLSAVRFRKSEQLKSQKNQYPLFSIYNADGSDANTASPIFAYKVGSDYNVAPELGLRVVVDPLIENYTFTQSLIGNSDELYAYVDKATTEYWVDKTTETVYRNIDSAWADKFTQGVNLIEATYSMTTPTSTYNGLVWFNPLNDVLSIYNGGSFNTITSVEISEVNPLINTIWKKATNQYIPVKKDWNARTEVEYNKERDSFIAGQVETIKFESPELTPSEVNAKALDNWLVRQSNKLSPSGEWVGDWTIPDYLYYNPANENKAEVTTRELIGHFESIINAQSRVPGYVGDLRSQFHVFTQEDVDFGIAGNIRQYNNNFSTFLSSVFIDNIIIPDLFEFAQNQYQILLDDARDIIISNLEPAITAKPTGKDISLSLIAQTVSDRSENSNLEFIYGDTTAFDVGTGIGVRNWIATLPTIGLVTPVIPSVTIDKSIDLYELVHHDGHRVNYAMDANDKADILKNIIAYYNNSNAYGFVSTTPPPANFAQLVSNTGASSESLTKGFYWINSTTQRIYSIYIDFIQSSAEALPIPVIDTYWLDTATPIGVLKYSDGIQWTVVDPSDTDSLFDGTSIETSNTSMWKEIDINELQLQNLLDIETRLYNAATVKTTSYSVSSDMEDFFLAYTKATGNTLPFVNSKYSSMDPFSWNYRDTVFGNNYELLGVDLLTNSFIISPAVAVFGNGSSFYIKNSGGNDGTWTVSNVTLDTILQTATLTVVEPITSTDIGLLYDGPLPSTTKNTGAESAVYWKALYNQIYSTPYPHLEPWKLQGFANPPTWWDAEYKNNDFTVYGTRRWLPAMWTNIIDGRVPSGKTLPSGLVSNGSMGQVDKYAYVSVNIGTTNVVADDGNVYKPDDLYPPYLDHLSYGLASGNRSLFSSINFEVLAPSANFVFGQQSQTEYEWRESSQFLYDFAVQSYKESPIDFVASTFGFNTFDINGLLIDKMTHNVPSYKRTTFHGEINGGTVEKFDGINQWYINYNRYTNVDTNFSNFYRLWTGWSAPLAYQFKSFIDTRTLDISSTQISVEPNIDYSVYVKKTNGVKSFSVNGLTTTLLQIPPKIVSHDNSHLWKVQVSNSSRRNNSISYYDVKNYPFYADVDTNIMKLYTYKITLVESIRKTINVAGDVSEVFSAGTLAKFSSGDEFNVFASTYNDATDTTTLYFNDTITSISNGDLITADVISLPWETGDSVWFTTERKLPAPLYGDTAPIGAIEYFIIKLSDNEFRVSETQRSALENLPTALVNAGRGVHYVGQIENTFVVGNGENTKNYWRHYALDTRVTKTINMPGTVVGIQRYVNIIDGYVAKLNELGFNFSESLYGWQTQIEKFIDYSFAIRQQMQNRTIGNRWTVKPNKATNSWSWDNGITTPPVPVGYAVNLVAANGVGLPTPFMAKIPYYMIHNSDGTFSLATSVNRAAAGIPLKLLDNGAANNIELYAAVDNITRYPRIEINTFKDKISFEPPFGVVSDVITGPFTDINVANSLRDQYGDPLLISDFVINRSDTKTDVFLTTVKRLDERPAVPTIDDLGSEGYHYISAATFYVDTYEHIVEFSDYTNDGNLIYNGFVGLNLKRLNMNFNRPDVKTLRPNIGGSSILIDNKNITTIDNIERMTDDLRYAYSSVAENESNRYAPYARETLGYNINSTEDYLESIDINEKSQFLFWQGLIQVKGSTRSIDSFINSKKFIDARIDEFWAYQVAEFGSTEEKEYPQMYINVDDIVNNNAKFEFISASEVAIPGYDNSSYDAGGYDIVTGSIQTNTGDFIAISINDNDRWYKQPDQAATLNNNGLVLYFESIAYDSIELTLSDYAGISEPVIVHNFKADSVVVVVELPDVGVDVYTAGNGFAAGDKELTLNNRYIPFIDQLTVFKNGVPLRPNIDVSDRNQLDANFITNDVISFAEPLLASDSIEVAYGAATLNPEIHFEIINANIIKFRSDELFTVATKITLWNLQSNFEAHNASKLIDVKSNTVVSNINLFDPARGMYNQTAFNDVNMISDIQPAFFNRTEKFKIEPPKPEGYITKRAWSSAEVGKIWLDTSELAYIPYYDEKVFIDVNDRLEHWGRQAGYSNLVAYEWVESNVPPAEYAEAVEDEQGNTDIPEHLQKSGTPKLTTFYIEYGPAPDYTLGMRELKPYVIEYSAILDGATVPYVPGALAFVIPVDFLNADYFNIGEYNIYVNGIFRETKPLPVSTFPSTLIMTGLNPQDYVQIVIDYNVDDDILEQAVEDGIIRQTYEYTEVVSYTDLGEEVLTYYFWVQNKVTRTEENLVSSKYIQDNWTLVDYPYLVLQQLELAELSTANTNENVDVSYSFAINKNNIDNYVGYLQMGQFQDSYTSATTNGSFTGGIGYQPDDVITLTGGAIVRVIASDGSNNGEVTDFEIMFSGTTQPTPGQPLQQSSSTGTGTGFILVPNVANIGGFVLKLGADLEAYATPDATLLTESSDTLAITLNGELLTEKNDTAMTGEYVVVDKRNIDIGRIVSIHDTIAVSYVSNKPTRADYLPNRYTRAIIRNIRNFVNENSRYTIRFRKDFTNDENTEIRNKLLHREWDMFRQYQQHKIDRVLWDKVTESMIGYKLTNSTELVPSVARRLYDTQNKDTTRYGLDTGQAFVNGTQALQTLTSDLNDVENEFRGIDVASFLALNDFTSPSAIITSMDTIYTTFPVADVNRIFFLFLNDALSNKTKYAKLLKTSMISVYGVKVLDTKELFDE